LSTFFKKIFSKIAQSLMALAKKMLKNIELSKKQPEKTFLLLYYRKEIKAEMEETYEKSEVEST
jgi:hypothetical protein